MSLTIVSTVVIGFKLELSSIYKTVTRYSEDTGAPYEKRVFSHKAVEYEGEAILSSLDDPDTFSDGSYIEGMEIFTWHDEDMIVLGRKAAEVKYESGVARLDTVVPEVVQRFAEKHGWNPELHLVLYVS